MNQDAFLANTRKTGWPATRRGLLKKLGGQMRLMGQVRAATGREEQGGVYAWLLDNFYVLEREYKQLCHTIRGLSDPEGFARLAQAFHLSLCRERKPLNSGTVSTIIAQKNSERELNWEQFTLCEAALRLSLLTEAGEAAAAPDAPDAAERIGYAVNGLYAVGSIDFLQIIQNYSTVEAILRQDPAGVYPNMDPASQGQYRERIYRLSRQEGISETALARRLIDLAQSEEEPPKNHVGYPLLHAPALTRPQKRRAALYLFLLPAASLLFSFLAGWYTNSVLTGVFCLLPVYELLRPICQSLCVRGMRAGFIPKMDVDKLPSDMKGTLVAVSLLLEPAGVGEKIEKRLTELYFSNREEGLCFGMLADLPSAKVPHTAQDDAMIRQAADAVRGLNRRYGDHFFLFVRSRTYSRTQGCFCGYERKRGAIGEFVQYLRGGQTSACCVVGDLGTMQRARYLLALDSDTRLEFDTAGRMIAAASHPLNRPVYGPDGRVESGYGVFVPRIQPELAPSRATPFSRVMTGSGGISGYDEQAREFYQDLFSQSIFTGKGLIDLDCFYRTCVGVFPPEQVLSHDILEGGLMGCAFLGDVEMADSEPQNLSSWLGRMHRWIRGDWQNSIFLRHSPRVQGKSYRFPVKGIVRFQIWDNLRRSLTPASGLGAILLALFQPRFPALLLALLGALCTAAPPLMGALRLLCHGGLFSLTRKFFVSTMPQFFDLLGQACLMLITLPVRALSSLDAVGRSLWRTFVSRKKLLEWTTAAAGDQKRIDTRHLIRRYLAPELLGLAVLALGQYSFLRALGLLFSLLLPVVAYSSRRVPPEQPSLRPGQEGEVREYVADMVRFYLDYATPARHGLPPDNVQFSPRYAVAERTSPTNIGFMLLSLLAARDFELISTEELCRRVGIAVETLEKLEKWHGNLYNWYDVRSLAVLEPAFVSAVDSGNLAGCLTALKEGLREYRGGCPALEPLCMRIEKLLAQTDLSPFYNHSRRLFSIGFERASGRMSTSHYDFLMSEARLLSYFALARRQVDRRHWGALSRSMSRTGGYLGPVSWTGTMFEYFMPHLLLPAVEGSLLDESLHYCLYCQRRRVRRQGLPWGISESGYYAFDPELNYQYKAHGVQSLGVKRGLDEETVLSPYSSFLVLPFSPVQALENLQQLKRYGLYGQYGFYEAVDFTPGRTQGASFRVVRSFMAHHLGMSIAACANAVFGGIMQRRFLRDRQMGSAGEFLGEKLQKGMVVYDRMKKEKQAPRRERLQPMNLTFPSPSPVSPRTTLLSNGEICEILSETGNGLLKYADIDGTLFDADLLRGGSGIFCLCESEGKVLSCAAAPFFDGGRHEAQFTESLVRFLGEDERIGLTMECFLPERVSASVRRVRIVNRQDAPKTVRLLFYCEPVLLRQEDFLAHISFSRLFVSCEHDPMTGTLMFSRRMKGGGMGGFLCAGFLEEIPYEFETDKAALLHAGGLCALRGFGGQEFSSRPLSPNAVCAIRVELTLRAKEEKTLHFCLSAARDREQARGILLQLRQEGKDGLWRCSQSPFLNHTDSGSLGLQLLGRILYHRPLPLESRRAIRENSLGQSGLWGMSISGDLPIVTLLPDAVREEETVLAYARTQELLRRERVEFDLAVLCGDGQQKAAILQTLSGTGSAQMLGRRGGIFLFEEGELSAEQRRLLIAVSCALPGEEMKPGASYTQREVHRSLPDSMARDGLAVYGGVFRQGEFMVDSHFGAPYCHVLANPVFGTLLSARSLGFTWAVNARENKLTPWLGDAGSDNRGEQMLLKIGEDFYDAVDGARASFSPQEALYRGRCKEIHVQTRVTVPPKGCQKLIEVTLENCGAGEQELLLCWYLEPVLGVNRRTAGMITGERTERGIVMRNRYQTSVPVAISMETDQKHFSHTFSRRRFLSGETGFPGSLPVSDPAGVLIVPKVLPPRRKEKVRFILRYAPDSAALARMPELLPAAPLAEDYIRIQTPDSYLNAFYNTLLQNQILASRVFGRTGFYQCSGAYGFRDQLQDVMNLCLLRPDRARIQIARCCAVQFQEGDVLHWWHALPKGDEAHPGGGLCGVRTRYSDDLIWLPLAIADYLEKTGDIGFLRREIAFLGAEELRDEEHDRYFKPERSGEKASVYHHGLRALERGERLSGRGLLLIGSGDWNDGFSSVGVQGKGESVWLTLFLSLVQDRYAAVCRRMGDTERALQLEEQAHRLRGAVDRYCWDGAWYTRATFDGGQVMGSAENTECRIDSLPQSFAVLSGMPDRERVGQALSSALRYLVDYDNRIIKLFDPPFQESDPSPGYVQAYPRGIRENGGQYTHAAVWLALALLEYGRTDEGYRLLKLLNPAERAANEKLSRSYTLEPYYLAADIYTHPACYGRGGWSIYTGAAGWYFSTVTSSLLGLRMRDGKLYLSPRLPSSWQSAKLQCRLRGTSVDVTLRRGEEKGLLVDGSPAGEVVLDGGTHVAVYTV